MLLRCSLKGLDILLHSLKLLKDKGHDISLTVAGSGQDSYVAEMRELVSGLSLEGEVSFVGFLTGESKAECLANADVFVLPSYDENFGLAVAEAMSVGLPVIVADGVALAMDIEKAGAGLVVPSGSVEELASAIEKVLPDPDMRQQLGQQARKLVQEQFNWGIVTGKLVRLYEDILEGGSIHRSYATHEVNQGRKRYDE